MHVEMQKRLLFLYLYFGIVIFRPSGKNYKVKNVSYFPNHNTRTRALQHKKSQNKVNYAKTNENVKYERILSLLVLRFCF